MLSIDAENAPGAPEAASNEGWTLLAQSSEAVIQPNVQKGEQREDNEQEKPAEVPVDDPVEVGKSRSVDGAGYTEIYSSFGQGTRGAMKRSNGGQSDVARELVKGISLSDGEEDSSSGGKSPLVYKSKPIAYDDGEDDLTDVLILLQDTVAEEDRWWHLKKYTSCFVGSEAVDLLVERGIGLPSLVRPQTSTGEATSVSSDGSLSVSGDGNNADESSNTIEDNSFVCVGQTSDGSSDVGSDNCVGRRAGAVAVMQRLFDAGLIQHVTDTSSVTPLFRDGTIFYRFVRDGLSEADVDRLLLAMWHPTEGIAVQDRSYLLKTYPRVFVGEDAVNWMMQRLGATRAEALELGNCLLGRGVLHHAVDEHHFKNKFLFYRWMKDEFEDTSLEGERPPLNLAKRVRGDQPHPHQTRSKFDAHKFLSTLYAGSPADSLKPVENRIRRFASRLLGSAETFDKAPIEPSANPRSPMLAAPSSAETGELAKSDPVAFSIHLQKQLLDFFAEFAFTVDGKLAFGRGPAGGIFAFSRASTGAHLNTPEYQRIMLLSCQLQLCNVRKLGKAFESTDRVAFFLNISHCLLMHSHIAAGRAPSSVAGARLVATGNRYCLSTGTYSIADIASKELFPNADAFLSKGGETLPFALLHLCQSFGTTASPRIRPYSGFNLIYEVKNQVREFLDQKVTIHQSEISLPAIIKWFARDLLKGKYVANLPAELTVKRRRQISESERAILKNANELVLALYEYLPQTVQQVVDAGRDELKSLSESEEGDDDVLHASFVRFEWEPAYGLTTTLHAELSDSLAKSSPILDRALREHNVPLIARGEVDVGPRIGVGGCAEVFKATYQQKVVALKRLFAVPRTPGDTAAQKALDEFAKELALVSQLKSRYIVELLGACVESDTYSILFEYMSLGSVFDIIHVHRTRLPLVQRYKFLRDTAKALEYLHSHTPPMIHRDVKPHNLLVSGEMRCKLGDFGLARWMAEGGESSSDGMHAPQTMSRVGTPQWCAPEILLQQPYSESVDCYSFGTCVWELYTQQVPYADLQPVKVIIEVATKNLLPHIPSDFPKDLEALIRACWTRTNTRRPTATQLALAIEKLIDELERPPSDASDADSIVG